jgi:DNA-binding CsgD family transcriptional regulator
MAMCERFVSALDLLRIGLVLLDRHGWVAHVNSAAAEITARDDGLSLDGNRLTARRPLESARLRKVILGTLSDGLRITRTGARYPYQVWVAHCSPEGAIVLIIDPDRKIEDAAAIAHKFYDLTPAEYRVCLQLMNGRTLAEASRNLGIRLDTAKSHLKKVFAKTHTRRQSELVRLLLQSGAAFRLI